MRALIVAAFLLAAQPIQVTKIVWKDGPPTMPKGTKAAVLEGDPRKSGIFTMRLKVPAGARILPHTHPRDERVTVISGEVRVGFGTSFDRANTKAFRAGSFYVNPPGTPHFLYVPKESVLQLTCEGPWEIRYVE